MKFLKHATSSYHGETDSRVHKGISNMGKYQFPDFVIFRGEEEFSITGLDILKQKTNKNRFINGKKDCIQKEG